MSGASGSQRSKAIRKAVREPFWAAATATLRPTASLRVLPDFVIAGAQRCGTTSLQNVLTQHPNITSARLMKGVHYFDTAYDRGADWYRTHFPTRAYARWKERSTGAPLRVGEASPYYMFHPLAPDRIKATLPGVKVIVLLRDPVERTISHHKHETRRGNETSSLEDALDQEASRIAGEADRIRNEPFYNSFPHQTYTYMSRSRYAPQVAGLFDRFGRDSVLVLQSEAFFEDPKGIYLRALTFLDVPHWVPEDFPHINATASSKVAEATRARLIEEFREPNNELAELLDERFAWQ